MSNIDSRNIESRVKQWSHPLMIPLLYLRAKSNNRKSSQFECDVLGFIFVLNLFVHMHYAVEFRLKLDVQVERAGKS